MTPSLQLQSSADPLGRLGIPPSYALLAVLTLSWLLPAGPFTALITAMLLLYAAYTPGMINAAALRLAFPFLVMTMYATLLASGNDGYFIGRDVWYGLKLCLCLGLGLSIGARETDTGRAFRMVAIFGVASAIWTLAEWAIYGNGSIGELDPDAFVEHLPLASVAAIPILLDQVRTRRGAPIAVGVASLCIIMLAIAVSQSRITVLAALAMFLAWTGLFANWRRALVGGLVVAVVGAVIWRLLPEYTGGPLTVAMKFRRSLDEMLFTDSYDMSQVYLNWRGFEAYNAQLMFDQSSLFRKFFGSGMGATVDLGTTVQLSEDASYRFLPILHNGFYYIVIKYGIIGLAVYLWNVACLIRWGRLSSDGMAIEDRMLRGLALCVLLSTAVITGLYNKTALHGVTILCAWLIGHACRMRMAAIPATAGQARPTMAPLPA